MTEILELVIRKTGYVLAEKVVETIGSKFENVVCRAREAEDLLKQIHHKLRMLQSSLNQAEMHKINLPSEEWMAVVRKIGDDVEGITDEYAYCIGQQCSQSKLWTRKGLHKSENIIAWQEIISQLKKLQCRLLGLQEIQHSIEEVGQSSSPDERQQAIEVSSNLTANQDDFIGYCEEKKKLVQWLTNGREARSVITVWGAEGLGKTTLVRNVFDSQEIKEHFSSFCVWISISKRFQFQDIIMEMLKKIMSLRIGFQASSSHCFNQLDIVRHMLKQQRYLIVLDGLRSMNSWCRLDAAFVRNCFGSRVVITTRNEVVTSLAIENVIELLGLGPNEAWRLFCRIAFKNEVGICPPGLEQWGRNIVSKCGRLPPAILAIGSLVSLVRGKQESEFLKLYEKLDNCDLTSSRCADSPWYLSFHYMPSYLKHCFSYCSIFPEDEPIKRRRLIRLWVAEGFIEATGEKPPEEVAEDYINELVQLRMLQVVERNHFGRGKVFRVNDNVRELTVTISLRDSFCASVDSPDVRYKTVRRLSVNGSHCIKNVLSGINVAHACTFIMFKASSSNDSLASSMLSSFRYLRVLDLQGTSINRVLDDVGNLFNLHYLGLRRTEVKELPGSLARLRNLQTLDLWFTQIRKLPSWITSMGHLRHLFACNASEGVEAPKQLGVLKELMTLQRVKANDTLVGVLGNLTELRSLNIQKVRGTHCEKLCSSITKMQALSTLYIEGSNENEVLQFQGLNPPPQLQKLNLIGRLADRVLLSPLFCSHGNKLRDLSLEGSFLSEDPLQSLSHFPNLTTLSLTKKAYIGQKLRFRAGWFPNLEVLLLVDMEQLAEIEIEEGTLQKLKILKLVRLKELKVLPFQYLVSLHQLFLSEIGPELLTSLLGADRSRFAGIRNINFQRSV